MSDDLLFYTAVFVFSLMALGLALTVIEFRSLRQRVDGGQAQDVRNVVADFLRRTFVPDGSVRLQPAPIRNDVQSGKRS